MEKSFTQRMDWLHTWFGLVLGWLAFALFLTGTIAVFWFEIQHWAQPELHGAKMLSLEDTVQYSVDYLQKVAPDSRRWSVTLPDLERHPLLALSWLDGKDAQQFARLVPDGSGRKVTTVTNGGRFFVDFHWTFNREVPDLQGRTFQWTYMLSGFVGMAFLICTITGLVVHKKIFRNFFTFRRHAKSVQTRWLDAHNVLGVLSWPFQFVIVLTGLVFYSYLYIPTGMQMAARYPSPPTPAVIGGGGPGMLWGRYANEVVGSVPGNTVEPGNPAPNVPIVDLFAQAEAQMGTLSSFTVNNPGRDNATVRFGGTRARPDAITFTSDSMTFDGATGRVISPPGNTANAVQKITNVFGGLHFAFFGGTAMRVLYFLCGAAGTIMIAAGLVMFTAKRRTKAKSVGARRFYELVDRLNVASVGGALFACASYLWALRLLPQSLSDPTGGFPGGDLRRARGAGRGGGGDRGGVGRCVRTQGREGGRPGAGDRRGAARGARRKTQRGAGRGTRLDFQDHWHNQRPARGLLREEALQVGADFFLHHAPVALFFLAGGFQRLHDDGAGVFDQLGAFL